MRAVLSSYPLSKGSIGALGLDPSARFYTLAELRLKSPREMIGSVRQISAPALRIVIQEASERAVLPLMLTLAAATRAKRIEVHDLSRGEVRHVSRWSALTGLLGIAAATVSGIWFLWRLGVTARRLIRSAPQSFAQTRSARALYLKTNLMLGAKAGGSIGHIAGVFNELRRHDGEALMLAPEMPPLVDPSSRFDTIAPLRTYGVPAEVNHFRFNRPCVEVGSRALSNESFGFIYQRLTLGNLSGVLLSRRFKVPLVIEYNGSEVWVSQNWGHKLTFADVASRIEDACLRHAHRVVTVSKVLADELVQRGVDPQRIVWYPNCIDPTVFDPYRQKARREELRTRLGIAPSDLVVLFIGTFGLWHGAETLAEAARLALAEPLRQGPRLRFVFVGDGLRLAAVRSTLSEEIERGDVILTGLVPQHEAPGYLAMADVFSSPHVPPADGSKFFGSPTKLFEYMAMARPIVASDLDQLGEVLQPALRLTLGASTPESLEGDETALLVEPGSAAAIVQALRLLQQRPEWRQRLGDAARRKALEQYTWRRHVDMILKSLRLARAA